MNKTALVIAVIVLIVGLGWVSWINRSATEKTGTTPTPTPVVAYATCPYTVELPSGYAVSQESDATSICPMGYSGTPELETPMLSVEKVAAKVDNLASWLSARLKEEDFAGHRDIPKTGALSNSLEVTSTNTAYASVETYISTEEGVYEISMSARDANKEFNASEVTLYRAFVGSFKLK